MTIKNILWSVFLPIFFARTFALAKPSGSRRNDPSASLKDDTGTESESDVSLSTIPQPIHEINADLLSRQAPADFQATFETSAGPFVVKVVRAWAPIGADRFYNLVQSGFYSGVRIHRIIRNSFIQFGIHGEPAVNRTFFAAAISDDMRRQTNDRWRVAFASVGANTRRTELIISLKKNGWMDKQGLVPFGQVVGGFDVLRSLLPVPAPGQASPARRWMLTRGNNYLARDYPALPVIVSASVVHTASP